MKADATNCPDSDSPHREDSAAKEAGVEPDPPNVRYASDEAFEQAHRKTTLLHAELFRRLAE
jgi:hypothetical protein